MILVDIYNERVRATLTGIYKKGAEKMGLNKKRDAQKFAKLSKLQGQRAERPEINWAFVLKVLYATYRILRTIRSSDD